MSSIIICQNKIDKSYSLEFNGDFSTKYIWQQPMYPTQVLDDSIFVGCLLKYINRRHDATTNNNRQISLWQKMVLFGLQICKGFA